MGRPTRGSRLHEFYADLDSASLKAIDGQIPSSLDSAFQLQEYISALVRANPHDVERIVRIPWKDDRDNKEKDRERDEPEVDEGCWVYEQLRRLALDLTYPLVDMLQQTCNRRTCPEMKAGEWLYLCVAHGSSGVMEQCCAIDYVVHTIDSATALLNSPRAFPSRLSIPPSSRRHFPSLARRLGRIFAHAYFHHREGFVAAEAQNSLYARFLALCRRFDLVPAEFLVIPLPQDGNEHGIAENGNDQQNQPSSAARDSPGITILSRQNDSPNLTNVNTEVHPPGSSSSTSRSPRNRLRTDTMYLTGTFHGINSGTSSGNTGTEMEINPRRVPSPLAATLASQEEEDERAALAESTIQSETLPEEEAPPEKATITSVPIIVSNAPAKVLVRDFALENSAILSEPQTTTTPDLDLHDLPEETISISVPNLGVPPIVLNAPQVVISSAPEDDTSSSLPKSDFTSSHKHVITEVSTEDDDEENPDVDDLEHALENDDDEDEAEDGEEEHVEGERDHPNIGMDLPESDITSASAIELRFEELAPERKPQEEHESGSVPTPDSSSTSVLSADLESPSNVENIDASADPISASSDTAGSTADASADATEPHNEEEQDTSVEVLEHPSYTEVTNAEPESKSGVEDLEHATAEPLSYPSSASSEEFKSQSISDETNSNQLSIAESIISSSDSTSSNPDPPTDEKEETKIEPEASFPPASSLLEEKANAKPETEG